MSRGKDIRSGINRLGKATLALAILTTSTALTTGLTMGEVYAMDNPSTPTEVVQMQVKIKFPDVVMEWQKVPVQWAVEREVVQGYPDGTFKPDNQVLESEFATMLARYASNIDYDKLSPLQQKHWSQHLYNELAKYDLPFKGYSTDEVKNKPVNRGTIAQIIAAKNGFNLTIEQAVEYLYENELSNGKGTVKDFTNFGANDFMTRAEATAFMQRLSTKGITTFRGVPSEVKADEILGIKNPVFDGTKEQAGTGNLEKVAKEVAAKYGFRADSGKTGADIRDTSNKVITGYGNSSGTTNMKANINHMEMSMEFIQKAGNFSNEDMKVIKAEIEVASKNGYNYHYTTLGDRDLQIKCAIKGDVTMIMR